MGGVASVAAPAAREAATRSGEPLTKAPSTVAEVTPGLDVFAKAWLVPEDRNFDGTPSYKNCGDRQVWTGYGQTPTYFKRRDVGKAGARRYHCVAIKTDGNGNNMHPSTHAGNKGDYVRYTSTAGHHPCRGLGESIIHEPKGSFSGANFGFTCKLNPAKVGGNLPAWESNQHMKMAGVQNTNNQFVSLYDQILLGVTTSVGSTKGKGVCDNISNLSKIIGKDGKTCFKYLREKNAAAEAANKAIAYCKTAAGRTDPKCACLITSEETFLKDCESNPTWAGCKQINKAVKELKSLNIQSSTGIFGNNACLVPNICGGADVYKGDEVPVCTNQIGICSQIKNMENVSANFGNVESLQECNINFADIEKDRKKELEDKAAAAAAEKKRQEDAAAAAAAQTAAAQTPAAPTAAAPTAAEVEAGQEVLEEIEPDLDTREVDPETGAPIDPGSGQPIIESEIIPEIAGIPMDTTMMLIGGGFLLCCMLLLLVMVSGRGGGGGGGGGGGRRR